MSRRCWPLLLALLALCLPACGGKLPQLPPDPTTDALARRAVELVKRGEAQAFEQLMTAKARGTATQDMIDELRVRIGDDATMENVSYRKTTFQSLGGKNLPPKTFVHAEYQLRSHQGFILLDLRLEGTESALKIDRFHVQPLPGELSSLNAWRFSGKALHAYLLLALVFAIPAFILYALYRCARTRLPRKWLWMLFVALGIGQLSLNWTSGALDYRLVSFQLLGVAGGKTGNFGPWYFVVSFPLGALLFLLKLRRIRRQAEVEVAADARAIATLPGEGTVQGEAPRA